MVSSFLSFILKHHTFSVILRQKYYYFFTESKKEFYEATTFDHFSLKRTIARLIRSPIKFIDKKNCSYAPKIISISYYSIFILNKIYKRNSFIIHPALKQNKPKKIKWINKRRTLLSVSQLSKIKGHDFTIQQVAKSQADLFILGRSSYESNYLNKLAKNTNTKIKTDVNRNTINNYLNRHKSIFLANNMNEPFGITPKHKAKVIFLGTTTGYT